jgi:hypothetical protein
MALLLSGKVKNPSSTSGYITLNQTQAALGNSPTTGTGYTIVTVNSQTTYQSTLGKLNFTFSNTATFLQSIIPNGNIIINPQGTGTLYINGPVVIPSLEANTAFKGPVRVATTSNVTLIGGAPNKISGVDLKLDDRILVKAQTNPAQNGIYTVLFLGIGFNGTWARAKDADTTEEISGAIVAISTGTVSPGRYFFTDWTVKQKLNIDPLYWYQIVGDGLSQELTAKTIDASPIGTKIPDVGYFTDLYSTGTFQANKLRIISTESSTSTTTGALIVAGGVGIGGNVNIGGNFVSTGTARILDSTSATSTWTGALQVEGGIGLNGALYARAVYVDGVPLETPLWNGGQISSPFYVANIEESFSTMTGALKVLGGVGIGGNIYGGKSLTLESRVAVDSVYLRMRNTATNGQSYTWNVGGNNAAGQGGTSLREGSLTLYDDRNSTYRLILVKSNGNLLVGQQTDNGVDKLQVAGSIQFGDAQLFTRSTSINNTSTTVVDSWPAISYRTAKSLVQITDGTGPTAKFHIVEIVVLNDNTGNVYKSEYGIITTGGEKGTFDVDYNVGGNGLVRLLFTAASPSNKTVKVQRTSITR